MNHTSILSVLFVLMTITALVEAAPSGADTGQRREGAGDAREELLKKHPELREKLEKLRDMTPVERKTWLKDHPEIAEKLERAKAKFKGKADDATPEQKEKLREKMRERFEKMTPEQRAELFKNHPELKEKLRDAQK